MLLYERKIVTKKRINMLRIRFRRAGRIHEPFYRIVVTEGTAPIQGKFLAQLGHYNPKTKDLVLNKEEALEWMNKGAKPSNTVAKLMKKEKIDHKSVVVVIKGKETKKAEKTEEIAEQPVETKEEKSETTENAADETPKEETATETK
jgi:small subunit ribosomal protein S16